MSFRMATTLWAHTLLLRQQRKQSRSSYKQLQQSMNDFNRRRHSRRRTELSRESAI